MLIAGAVIGSAPRVGAEAELVNGVQAVVHDSIVTFGEVQIMTMPAEQMLYRQYRDPAGGLLQKAVRRPE